MAGAAMLVHCPEAVDPLWKSFLNPALVLISAAVAWLGIRNVRSVARQKATLDLIEKVESTEHYRKLNTGFSAVRRADDFARLHDPETDDDKVVRGQVQDYLNHYELVAIGIRQNILDARIYRTWMQSAFIRDWNAAADFIQRERWKLGPEGDAFVYHPQLFANYQLVAAAWSRDVRVIDNKSSPPPPIANGEPSLSDDPLPVMPPPDL